MRRIPAKLQAYQRWLHAWADLKARDHPDLKAVAQQHGFSKRQIEFTRRAGRTGLPVPPAALHAELAPRRQLAQPQPLSYPRFHGVLVTWRQSAPVWCRT